MALYKVKNVLMHLITGRGTDLARYIPRYELALYERQWARTKGARVLARTIPKRPRGSVPGSVWPETTRYTMNVTAESEYDRLSTQFEYVTKDIAGDARIPLFTDVYRTFADFEAAFKKEVAGEVEIADEDLDDEPEIDDEEAAAIREARNALVNQLLEIDGIGADLANDLIIYLHVESVQDVSDKTIEELRSVPGIGAKTAAKIKDSATSLCLE